MWKAKNDVILREIGEQSIIIPTGSQVVNLNGILILNSVGECLWRLLDGQHDLEQLAHELADRYDVGIAEAQCDIQQFLDQANQMGLLSNVTTTF